MLAQKFKATKFLKIIATEGSVILSWAVMNKRLRILAIKNYPDRNCPTMLIYYEGNLKQQIVGVAPLGGLSATAEGINSKKKK